MTSSTPSRNRSRSRSSHRGSPPRQTPHIHRRDRSNGGGSKPGRKKLNGSPTIRLTEEFGRILLSDDRSFHRALDKQAAEQERLHRVALDLSLAEHEAVRQSAERARERVELEIERGKRLREEIEKKELEQQRRELVEREAAEQKRQLNDLKRQEKEREQKAAIAHEKAEAERRIEAQKKLEAEQEAKRKTTQAKEAADREEREAAITAPRSSQQQSQDQISHSGVQQPNGTATATRVPQVATQKLLSQPPLAGATLASALVSSIQDRDAVHKRYLDLHERLKEMRIQIKAECKKIPGLLDQLSEWRRLIQSRVGQTNKIDKIGNQRARETIHQALTAASRIEQPSIDVSQFIIGDPEVASTSNPGPTHGSGCLLFLLNHFAKSIINQLMAESGVDSSMADPTGILATWIFSQPAYCVNGQSLIDVLWAKYHRVCPALFGIYGDQRTAGGRARIGWWKEGDITEPKSTWAWIPEQLHFNRMSGLGAGFAALTLRDFSKSRNRNPAPNRIFWRALARLVGTPPADAQPTHYILVKALIHDHAPRIIAHFGAAGRAAMRKALVDFPRAGPRDAAGRLDPVCLAVETLALTLQRDLQLSL